MITSVADSRKVLGECALFRGLAADDRAALISRAHIRTYAPGESIFNIGSPGDSLMAVLSGNIRISVPSPEGKEIVLAILHQGDLLGEIALLDGKERSADAKAMTDGSCLAILNRRDVMSFLDRHPSAWAALVEVLCQRLRRTDEQFAEVALMQVPVRLAKALLRLTTPKSKAQVNLSQRELGSMVGATRESVNKCLREWQQRGLVHMEDAVISITDREAMEELADLGLG
jgi:CRP-like cAMP-binding protein